MSGCVNHKTNLKSSLDKIPDVLTRDVSDLKQVSKCPKKIEVIGDFEYCYKSLNLTITNLNKERCYMAQQIQQIVWVATDGKQLIKLPKWCDTFYTTDK